MSEGPVAPDGSGENTLWTTDPAFALPIQVAKEGSGALPPVTVMEVFESTAKKFPNKAALKWTAEDKKTWNSINYSEYFELVRNAARALIQLGVQPHTGISILGFNSVAWFVADLAAIFAGAVAAGIYTTNGPEACRYIIDHCGASVVFVQDDKQLKKLLEVRELLPSVKKIVQWEGKPESHGDWVISWDDFLALGKGDNKAELDKQLDERIKNQNAGHCCTLIYTSGTTAAPKAVMISHDNVTWTARSISKLLELGEETEIISYLPLSHVAAQLVDLHAPIVVGGTISFAQPDALKGSLVDTLKQVRPTVFLGVPRVWEKMQEKMQKIGQSVTGLKKTIATWAKKKGLEGGYAEQEGKSKGFAYKIANSLVFSKIRDNLGLDRAKITATSAAPISKDTLEYFLSIGIPLYEIYGMSECTGPQTISYEGHYKTGSCGRSIDGSTLSLMDPDKDGNGEICYKGRHIFMGYMRDPASTGQTIDKNGFLHSGDIGRLDSNGFLSITGRIKELIITAGGENIPPVLIENCIKEHLPWISNVMVIGDKKKFLSAVVTLSNAVDDDGTPSGVVVGPSQDKLKELGIAANAEGKYVSDDLLKNEVLRKAIEDGMKKANEQATSNAQKIQKFEILPRDFSINGGELTGTMKLKRREVLKKYDALIEGMYAGGGD